MCDTRAAIIAAALPHMSELFATMLANDIEKLGRYEVSAPRIRLAIRYYVTYRALGIESIHEAANDVARAFWTAVIRCPK